MNQGKSEILLNQLNKKLGSLSDIIITKIESCSNEKLDEISLQIFDITSEEDLNKLLAD